MANYTVSLTDQISANAAKASASLVGLSTAMRTVAASAATMTASTKEATPALKEASAAAAGMAPAATSAASATSSLPAPLMAVKVAALAVVAALTAVALGLYEAARAAISFNETRDGIIASLDAFTGKGPEAVAMLDKLGKALPFTTERMAKWSTTLASAGVRSLPELQRGVMAAASATALMRDATDATADKLTGLLGKWRMMAEEGKGEKFDVLAKKLKGLGVDVNDVAAELGTTASKLRGTAVDATKLGEAVQNALINKGKGALEVFGAQATQVWAKFKEGVAGLFEGLGPDVQALMGELRGIAEEFTRDSASANVMKSAVTTVFHTLFSVGTTALHAIHIGFLDLEIYALKAAIAIAPAVKAVRGFFRSAEGSKMLANALIGVKVVAVAVGAAAAVAAVSVAAIGFGAFRAVAAIGQLVSAVGRVGGAIKGAASAISSWAKSSYQAAADFVGGLVNGLTAGIGRVVAAAKSLGSSAVNAVKSVLHIQSPSRVMAEVGLNTARGMAGGIDAGESDVARAARSLGSAAVGGASSVTNNGGSRSANLKAELHIHHYGGGGIEIAEAGFGSLIERLATQAGIVPAAVAQ